MASKFMRRRMWWVKFHHPVTGVRIRESLETHDPARAELLRQRIECEVALRDPRFGAADIPPRLRRTIDSWNHERPASPMDAKETSPAITAAPPASASTPTSPTTRVAVDEALRGYFDFIRTDNELGAKAEGFPLQGQVDEAPSWKETGKCNLLVRARDSTLTASALRSAQHGFTRWLLAHPASLTQRASPHPN